MAKSFKIYNVRVYGIRESIVASRYPMIMDVAEYEEDNIELEIAKEKQKPMAVKLSNLANESGLPHDCYLKGIIVQYDVTYPAHWALQNERYHFRDTISSNSKMHRLKNASIKENCNEWVDEDVIFKAEQLQKAYNEALDNNETDKAKTLFLRLLNNLPQGYMLTMRETSNYLELKNQWKQRRHHRLPEWQTFCDWVETLPMMKDFLGLNN